MQSLDDIGLLRQYATCGSEAAFEMLVNRRIALVYSAALRQVRDPQLAEEFWKGFVDGARVTLHLRSLSGKNGHHVIEASFKGVARSLHDAVRIEGDDVPSTKGTLTG